MANVILLQKGDLKKSDFTNDNSNNKEGIGIRLSSAKGNLIQQRKDGLYYGVEAPPDTANLYVSSTMGDDGNAGTRNAPLKTIREAIARNSVGTQFKINLYETDVHEWRGSWGAIATGKLFAIEPYGAVTDAVKLRNPRGTVQWLRSRELYRPTIRFKYDGSYMTGNTEYERNKMSFNSSPLSGFYRINGVILDYTDTEGKDLALATYELTSFGYLGNACSMRCIGCDFILDNHAGLFTASSNCAIAFDGCNLNYQRGNFLGEVLIDGVVALSVINAGVIDGQEIPGTPPGQQPLTFRATSATTEFGAVLRGIDRTTITRSNIISKSNLF